MKIQKLLCPLLIISMMCGCNAHKALSSNGGVHQEFGDSQHEKYYEDTYMMNITYPNVHIEEVDEAIQKQLDICKQAFQSKLKTYAGKDKAELNIDYQSYLKDHRYISIMLDVFESLDDQHEQIYTIVYDEEKEQIIGIEDVLKDDFSKTVSALVQDTLKQQYPDECETKDFQLHTAPAPANFEDFILRKDALVLYFQEGRVLDHSVSVEIPYEDIDTFTSMKAEDVAVFVPYEDFLNEPVKNIDPDKPMIALTFDDGPSKKYTPAILDALQEHQASATFFVLGSRATEFPDILQRMVLEGNEIGNHTFSHKQLTTLSKENIEEEITHTQETIHDVTNKYPQVIRPPYGSKNDTVMECAQGKKIVTWSLDTLDWKSRNTESVVQKVLADVKDGDIILMHDLYASTAEAAIILIPKLQEMGFQLVTVSELYEYGKHDAGKIT